jgi:hypothetical protein
MEFLSVETVQFLVLFLIKYGFLIVRAVFRNGICWQSGASQQPIRGLPVVISTNYWGMCNENKGFYTR